VVGIVPDYISDRGAIVIGRQVFETHWKDSTINWIFVFTDPGTSHADMKDRIQRTLGQRYLLKALSPAEGMEYLAGKIETAYEFTYAIQLLVVVVTVAGIFDLLIAAIWERRRELALWRVIGADDRSVHRSVVIESATIGSLGAALGIVLGLITTWTWISINYRYLLGYYIEYHFDAWTAARLIALIIVVTIVAGYFAARYATRQPVLEGIQVE
jgi:putative ABC transport system permease protein